MSYYADNRKSIMNTITQRITLERRIKRTQRQLETTHGEARQALQDRLATDLAAVAEMTLTLEDAKARLRQEEEHIRRKTNKALRHQDELKRSQFLNSYPGAAPPSPGQALALLVVLTTIVAITSAMLLLNK